MVSADHSVKGNLENMIYEKIRGSYFISTDPSKLQIDAICGFLWRSHWAAKRPREIILKSIAHSLCYGIYYAGKQVSFARLVTDYSTYGYLCDVYVDEEFRGQGLSKWLMTCIMEHPELQSLRRLLLATKDAHGLYARFGFEPLSGEECRRYMCIFKDDT